MTTETETAIEECKHHWQIASGISPQGHGRRGLRHAVGTGAAAMNIIDDNPYDDDEGRPMTRAEMLGALLWVGLIGGGVGVFLVLMAGGWR